MADITVDATGHVTSAADGHGGGGGGTKKGGIFTKLYTTVASPGTNPAFTISRATTGAMVFDVMFTSDTSATCAITKKYTVVKAKGEDPIWNKILDTGPDGSNDFTPVFSENSSSDIQLDCVITPAGTNTQKIGITIDLGFGQNDATVVMNA
jgi:hypothetical protein